MLLMFKDGIRGGVATATHRFGRPNNKYMGEGHDSSKPSKYIIYLDTNNLYGWSMSKTLPTRGFKWMNEEELEDWRSFSCILEVDLKYPKSFHDPHNERLGLKITKIHRGIKFEESAWLKEYIDLNIKLRTEAKNNFDKDFFKLMNNCVFGKTIENIENRVDIKLVTDKK